MKKLIFIVLIILTSCSTINNINNKLNVEFYNYITNKPNYILDSISIANNIKLNNYITWNKSYFVTQDSIKTIQYINGINKNDTLYIFSVTNRNDDKVIIKFRIEK